jgi:flavin-dependent dehydrogenase
MTVLYDVAILGATPAGFAAAYVLAKAGKKVIVVAAPPSAAPCPLADWVSADLFRLTRLPAGLAKAAKTRPFQAIHYHSVALDRRVEYRRRSAMGYFLQPSDLTAALASAARKAGAKVSSSSTLPVIKLEEDGILLSGSCEVAAQVLIIAEGQPHDVLDDLGLAVRTPRSAPLIVAGLDVPFGGKNDGALHVVEEPERSEIGMFFVVGGHLHLRVISSSPAIGTRAAELSALVARLQQAGLIPAKLSLHCARGAVWRPPAGAALELETHAAKRCLLAGTAGGFAEVVTGQTLYTSVASALLAAEVAGKALARKDPQTTLAEYGTSWRRQLEKRLLRPSTPFQVILPLVFANPKVAKRLTSILLCGQDRVGA